MTEQENIKLVHDAFAALNSRNLDAYCAHLDDSYVWDNDAFPAPVHGKDGARQAMSMYFAAFPDLVLELDHIVSSPDGNFVVNCWRARGTHQGEFRGIPGTNLPMHTRGCTVSEMRNGRIIHSITYTDQLALLHQITTPPKSASAD